MPGDERPPTLDQVIGANVRRLREAQGWSQDQFATLARNKGLNWTRSTVAAVEAGAKTLDLGEFLLLVVTASASVNDLLAGSGRVQIAEATPKLSAVLAVLEGRDAYLDLITGDLGFPPFNWAEIQAALVALGRLQPHSTFQRRRRRYERLAPGITRDPAKIAEAERAASGEAEMKAARKLRVDALDLTVAAFGLWNRSLTQERDARVAESEAPNTPSRSIQALRGRVTRQLLEDLKARLKEGTA